MVKPGIIFGTGAAVLLFCAVVAAAMVPAYSAPEPDIMTGDVALPQYDHRDYRELGVRVETVVDGLQVPWSLDWLPDGTMIFTERIGAVSIIRAGHTPEQILAINVGRGEGGMLGVAVDPDFEANKYVYVYYTYGDMFSLYNKIERYRYDIDTATLQNGHTLVDKIPASQWHDGGRIQFGPDGMLYATTGDAIKPELSQDIDSLAGKILRLERDGSVPDDNPKKGSLVYSMGHRNPQGMDWDYKNTLVATEHGPSGNLGVGHDEINIIRPWANYGWPAVIGDGGGKEMPYGSPSYSSPAYHTGARTWAPSGSEFYESHAVPEWNGRYFVSTLFGKSLQMIQFDSEYNVKSHAALFSDDFGRLRDVQTGPDGYLYLLTSNRDGRGDPHPSDDRILRILPLYEPVRGAAAYDGTTGSEILSRVEQKITTLTYTGDGTAESGPLEASLRHPGYETSDISLDIYQKSLAFDFERAASYSQYGEHGFSDSSLSMRIERPLLSAPFDVLLYDSSGDLIFDHAAAGTYDRNGAADGTADVRIAYENDHYIITIEPNADSGRAVIVGTHVIPEYGLVALGIFAACFAAFVLASAVVQSSRTNLARRSLGTGLFHAS